MGKMESEPESIIKGSNSGVLGAGLEAISISTAKVSHLLLSAQLPSPCDIQICPFLSLG